ncbi:xylose isomerase domain-containing protein [Methanocaldococcus villosus KIN24-T80]|uniref:Xylose isomerase domain-containing protein n=1 Tax=Methanocaldococcus villosus KIN24-T80 TaxID=1069083 RepID=N6VPS2_9EURY|nr:sugar phosphate isomerase/epimerase family protein [Methanocaldococcus villosus]ENN95895.1 xylose isomerase domain-containing protein [Methanocaldococcus villosus KIN24-T80]
MKIGISNSLFIDNGADLQKTLEFIEKKTKIAELVCDGKINALENKDVLDNYKLKYTLHAPMEDLNISCHREKIRKASIEYIEEILKIIADKIGVIVIHPGEVFCKDDYEKSLKAIIKSIGELNKLQNEYGVKIAIENMPNLDRKMFKRPEKEIINNLNEVGICLDMGHAHLNNAIEEFLNYKEKIVHVHIHDNLGINDDHLPIGFGKIDFEKYKKDLKKLKAIFILEHKYRDIEYIDSSLNSVKSILS